MISDNGYVGHTYIFFHDCAIRRGEKMSVIPVEFIAVDVVTKRAHKGAGL